MSKTTLTISEDKREIFDISKIIEGIIISEGVTFIGGYAFYGYLSLIYIIIPKSVTKIDNRAFCNCTSLKSIYINKEKGSLDLSKTIIPKDCRVYWKGEF